MAKSHSKRDSSSNSKESKKTVPLYRCEVCKIEISSYNRESHENGRKHKNNATKLQRKSGKQKADTNLAISDEISKSSEAPISEIPGNSDNNTIFPEDSKKPAEQSSGPAQVNSDMSNQSSHQRRYHCESETDPRYRPMQRPYRGRDHYDGFRPSPHGNWRNYNNRNFGRPPWNQESANWNNVECNKFFPPPSRPVRRYFSNSIPDVNPCEVNPFFPNLENSYDAFNSNENFYPFVKRKFPSQTSTETFDDSQMPTFDAKSKNDNLQASTYPANEEKHTSCETSVTDAIDKAKSLKPKSIRRRTQSVREITNASLAARSSIDSDDTLDATGDKQERKNSASENTTGKKIAQWINPSNRKDEAEVRRLVTEFSKSKKKENLLKLKQQSESRMERKDSDELITNMEIDKLIQDSPKDTCTETSPPSNQSTAVNSKITNIETDKLAPKFPKATCVETPSTSNQSTALNSKSRTSLNSESGTDLQSPKSRRPITKVSSTKASPRIGVGSLQSELKHTESSTAQKKRKSSTEKSSSKVKKFTNSHDLEACLNSVVNGIYDTSLVSDASVSSTRSQSLPEISVPERVVPIVKKEPVDSIAENNIESFADSLNLNEFLQNQVNLDNNSSSEATMTPVESLINLFASGNVIVKKEFDDPVIDAIRTVDPAVFDRVCDSQSTTSKKCPVPPPAEKPQPVAPPAEKPHPSVTGSLKAILKQLQKISDKELKIKGKLQEADQKIQEYQLLLEEWKTKKIKFQSEEDYLGHQRNTLVKSMNDLVTGNCSDSTIQDQEESDEVDSTTFNILSETPSIDSQMLNSVEGLSTNNSFTLSESSNNNQTNASTSQKTVPVQNINEEEIAILPTSSTVGKKEVPIIDLDEVYPFKDSNFSSSIGTLLPENTVNDKLSEWKVLSAHEVVINSIQVFEDFLYTSSIDNTARRFNLKDLSETVTYYHEKKNVTHLCVEKVSGMTVVFTACAASNVVSAFKAEDGTFIKSYKFASNVASLCKGRDKIYVGLRNGYIFTCNQKEQKEIVDIGDPIRSIALTYQGCISILVTLAINGSVSIRDAERNGLLIRTVKPQQKNVPLFMTVDGDCIYLSGSGVLMGVEIGTARCVQLHDLIAPYTSLTVYQGNIFTTSYSGLVRCHSRKMEKSVTVYYGAGNTALTCINVYNGWVFTGNRFGAVDVFKFEPNTFLPCQLGKCDLIFSREKDLMSHALLGRDHDLPSAGSKCSWRTCREKIPHNSDLEVIKCHIREHVQATAFKDNFDL